MHEAQSCAKIRLKNPRNYAKKVIKINNKRLSSAYKTGNGLKDHNGKWQLPLLILLVLFLSVLAGIQHYYLGKLSEAEQLRLKINLELMAENFAKDFDSELTSIQQALRFEENSSKEFELRLQQAYSIWKQEASFPDLIKDIYSLEFTNGEPSLNIYNFHNGIFSHSDWPVELESLKRRLTGTIDQAPSPLLTLTQAPLLYKYPLIISGCLNCRIADAIVGMSPTSYISYIIIVLDPEVIQKGLIPALSKRYFPIRSDLGIDILISKQDKPDELFYISSPGLDIDHFTNPEIRAEIGKWTNRDAVTINAQVFYMENSLELRQKGMKTVAIPDEGKTPILHSESKILKIPVGHIESWELMLKYKNDTLEGIVNKARRRNLFVSYCILAVLGISMVMVYISTRRANSLAQQQLKFVSGVSHELRTPLSVIRSAGENLADGLISDMAQQKRYGELIRDEGRRLSTMVENILSFSALQNDNTTLNLKAANIVGLLEECISMRPVSSDMSKSNIRIESDSKVPQTNIDYDSIMIAFNNIIDNSIKYSPNGSPVLIRIKYTFQDSLVEIIIEDHGRGIDSEDLPYIFDPFFRGKNTEEQGTPGSGIGLNLVNDIIKKHGGKIEVNSQRHKGTTVSIFLPVA